MCQCKVNLLKFISAFYMNKILYYICHADKFYTCTSEKKKRYI